MQANVVMGDVSEVLSRMLAPSGVDKYLFTITDVIEVPKHTLKYTNYDKAIMRHYEGAMMPSYKYYIFAQKKVITVYHQMFGISYTVQKMELNHFLIPLGISHKIHT